MKMLTKTALDACLPTWSAHPVPHLLRAAHLSQVLASEVKVPFSNQGPCLHSACHADMAAACFGPSEEHLAAVQTDLGQAKRNFQQLDIWPLIRARIMS